MIREAKKEDIEALAKMGELFHKESKVEFGWDPLKVKITLEALIDAPECFFYVYDDGDIKGAIAVTIASVWFSNESLAQEIFWYVSPEHRGVGHKLLKKVQEDLTKEGVEFLTMFTIDQIDDMESYFNRMKYKRFEHTYIKRL